MKKKTKFISNIKSLRLKKPRPKIHEIMFGSPLLNNSCFKWTEIKNGAPQFYLYDIH